MMMELLQATGKRIAITGRLKILPLSGTENVWFMSVKPGQPEESDVKKQLSRKHEQGHNIGFALEHGFTKDSEEHKKTKNTAREELERHWDFNLISAQVNKAATLLTC